MPSLITVWPSPMLSHLSISFPSLPPAIRPYHYPKTKIDFFTFRAYLLLPPSTERIELKIFPPALHKADHIRKTEGRLNESIHFDLTASRTGLTSSTHLLPTVKLLYRVFFTIHQGNINWKQAQNEIVGQRTAYLKRNTQPSRLSLTTLSTSTEGSRKMIFWSAWNSLYRLTTDRIGRRLLPWPKVPSQKRWSLITVHWPAKQSRNWLSNCFFC